jgi:hypothetical protein
MTADAKDMEGEPHGEAAGSSFTIENQWVMATLTPVKGLWTVPEAHPGNMADS